MTEQDGNQILQRYYDTCIHWLLNHLHVPAEMVMVVRDYICPLTILFLDPDDLFIDLSGNVGSNDGGETLIDRCCYAYRVRGVLLAAREDTYILLSFSNYTCISCKIIYLLRVDIQKPTPRFIINSIIMSLYE